MSAAPLVLAVGVVGGQDLCQSGVQRRGNVLWRSDDGHDWTRVELGEPVNVGAFTSAAGPRLSAVAEFGGRTVLIGEHSTYVSDDLETWERSGGPASDPFGAAFWSAAAGPAGFVAVGEGAWFSADRLARRRSKPAPTPKRAEASSPT